MLHGFLLLQEKRVDSERGDVYYWTIWHLPAFNITQLISLHTFPRAVGNIADMDILMMDFLI